MLVRYGMWILNTEESVQCQECDCDSEDDPVWGRGCVGIYIWSGNLDHMAAGKLNLDISYGNEVSEWCVWNDQDGMKEQD